MKKYEWVDVTDECKFGGFLYESNGSIRGFCLLVQVGFGIHAYFGGAHHVCCMDDYRILTDSNGFIRVEKRVKVEPPKPIEVMISAVDMKDRYDNLLGSKLISYRSAVELGLVEEDSDE